MNFRVVLALCAIAFSASCPALAQDASSTYKARIIEIERQEDLSLAQKIDSAITAASKPMTACVDAGEALKACQCKNKDAVVQFQRVAAEILAKKPEWKAESTVLYWKENGVSHNLAVMGIVKAMNESLKFCK